MDQVSIIEKTTEFVKETLKSDHTGHDWSHIERVYKLACFIADKEQADLFVVALAALLHDIKDHKFTGGDSMVGAVIAYNYLMGLNVSNEVALAVKEIVLNMSYKGGLNSEKVLTREGQIVQDADRLDAIGAIGIARTFSYGGSKKRIMYNPDILPQTFDNVEAYLNSQSTTINHFYEKLLKLKDLMHTATAKTIASSRHQFMEDYLQQFYSEWDYQA